MHAGGYPTQGYPQPYQHPSHHHAPSSHQSHGMTAHMAVGQHPSSSVANPFFEKWYPNDEENVYINKWFYDLDENITGTIGGAKAVEFMKKSNLKKEILREVWNVVDYRKAGHLDRDQFVIVVRMLSILCYPIFAGRHPSVELYNHTVKQLIPLPVQLLTTGLGDTETSVKQESISLSALPNHPNTESTASKQVNAISNIFEVALEDAPLAPLQPQHPVPHGTKFSSPSVVVQNDTGNDDDDEDGFSDFSSATTHVQPVVVHQTPGKPPQSTMYPVAYMSSPPFHPPQPPPQMVEATFSDFQTAKAPAAPIFPFQTWSPSEAENLKISQWFIELDTEHTGSIGGAKAVEFMKRSHLKKETLREVWNVVDYRREGQLDRAQFVVVVRMLSVLCHPIYAGQHPSIELYNQTVANAIPLASQLNGNNDTEPVIHSALSHSIVSSIAPGRDIVTSDTVSTSDAISNVFDVPLTDAPLPSILPDPVPMPATATASSEPSSPMPMAYSIGHPAVASVSVNDDFEEFSGFEAAPNPAIAVVAVAEVDDDFSDFKAAAEPSPIVNPFQTWSPSEAENLKISQWFIELDTEHTGSIGGAKAVEFMKRSHLKKETLREVWNVVDYRREGQLDRAQFVVVVRMLSVLCHPIYAGQHPSIELYNQTVTNAIPLASQLNGSESMNADVLLFIDHEATCAHVAPQAVVSAADTISSVFDIALEDLSSNAMAVTTKSTFHVESQVTAANTQSSSGLATVENVLDDDDDFSDFTVAAVSPVEHHTPQMVGTVSVPVHAAGIEDKTSSIHSQGSLEKSEGDWDFASTSANSLVFPDPQGLVEENEWQSVEAEPRLAQTPTSFVDVTVDSSSVSGSTTQEPQGHSDTRPSYEDQSASPVTPTPITTAVDKPMIDFDDVFGDLAAEIVQPELPPLLSAVMSAPSVIVEPALAAVVPEISAPVQSQTSANGDEEDWDEFVEPVTSSPLSPSHTNHHFFGSAETFADNNDEFGEFVEVDSTSQKCDQPTGVAHSIASETLLLEPDIENDLFAVHSASFDVESVPAAAVVSPFDLLSMDITAEPVVSVPVEDDDPFGSPNQTNDDDFGDFETDFQTAHVVSVAAQDSGTIVTSSAVFDVEFDPFGQDMVPTTVDQSVNRPAVVSMSTVASPVGKLVVTSTAGSVSALPQPSPARNSTKPMSLSELRELAFVLARKHWYGDAYSCACQSMYVEELQRLMEKKLIALEEDDLETAVAIKNASAVISKKMESPEQERQWLQLSQNQYKGQSLAEMHEAIGLFDELKAKQFHSKFITTAPSLTSCPNIQSLKTALQHFLIAQRTARLLVDISSSHGNHPQAWLDLLIHFEKLLMEGNNALLNFTTLSSKDQSLIADDHKFRDYSLSLFQIAESAVLTAVTSSEALVHEMQAQKVFRLANEVLKLCKKEWGKASELVGRTMKDITIDTSVVRDRRGVRYCNLSLRPLFQEVNGANPIVYHEPWIEMEVEGNKMHFIKPLLRVYCHDISKTLPASFGAFV